MDLLRDCNLKKSENCCNKRLIFSASPSSKISKIFINKNMKLVIKNM